MPRLVPACRTWTLLAPELHIRRLSASVVRCSTRTQEWLTQAAPTLHKPRRTQSRIQPKEALAWPDIDLETLHALTPGIRARQHVNPFRPDLQAVVPPLNWQDIFQDATRPLAVDVGCAKFTNYNVLGVDIRQKLIDRANKWAELLQQQQTVHYHLANATVSLQSMLSSYPGPVQLICVQYPDPHWKTRYRKRRIVQPQLVQAIADMLSPDGQVFLQSDVQEVVAAMRDEFEYNGSFRLADIHRQPDAVFFTDSMQVKASPRESLERQSWASSWHKHGWLKENPLGVPTEREIHTIEAPAPVFRCLLNLGRSPAGDVHYNL